MSTESTDGVDRRAAHDFDPRAEEDFSSAHAIYADLRQRCPVARSQQWGGFWALTRHADVSALLSDPRYTTSVQNVVPKFAFTGRRPPLHLDPPEHTDYREVINRFFSKPKMARLEPLIRRDTVALLQPLIDSGETDIALDFAHRIPAYVFAEFFNLPRELAMTIREVTKIYVAAIMDVDDEVVKQYSLRLYDIARSVIAQREAEPMDPAEDLTTALLAARPNGQPLPPEMVLGCVRQLLVTGMVAPAVFIGTMFAHLAGDPALHQQLRADPSLIPAALEEYLRLFTPYRGMSRTAKEDVVLHGQTIRTGEPIALIYASANRDESVFPDGDRFILNRPNINKHIAFGRGIHQCAGIPLARLMLGIALEEFVMRAEHCELAGPVKMARWAEWGTTSVPLRVRAAPMDATARA
jgi:cytochrome P450